MKIDMSTHEKNIALIGFVIGVLSALFLFVFVAAYHNKYEVDATSKPTTYNTHYRTTSFHALLSDARTLRVAIGGRIRVPDFVLASQTVDMQNMCLQAAQMQVRAIITVMIPVPDADQIGSYIRERFNLYTINCRLELDILHTEVLSNDS